MAKHVPGFVRLSSALLAWLVGFSLAPVAVIYGQSTEDFPGSPVAGAAAFERDARLESVERQLEALRSTEEARVAEAAQRPTLQIGGMVQTDYLFIGQNAANRDSIGDVQDVVDLRRARLTGRGQAFEVVEYSVGFDFALTGRPTMLDNWVAVNELPLLGSIQAGHFFEPFSLERYTLVRYTTFLERSLADALAPARNMGLMTRNTLGDAEHGTWAMGWFRANSDVFGDDSGDNGGWAVTSRGTWLPIDNEADDGRSLVHVGAGYTYRTEDERQIQFLSFPEGREGTPRPTGIPPFVDTGLIAARSDQRLGAELAILHGPLSMQAEYLCTWVDQIGGPRLFFHGAYGFVSYFLTGENRTYDKQRGTIDRVYPIENFFRVRTETGTATGRGAWEVAARWSFLDLDSRNIQGGTLNNVTLALNWHLNPYTRVKWEYIYSQLDRAPVGNSFAQFAGMRFDIDF
jgi:phosphate-selective porin OprO and OprP